MALVAEALSDGRASLSEERCKEVTGKAWDGLLDRLKRSRRVRIDGDLVHLTWVGDALAVAAKRVSEGRKRRGGGDAK